jgi:general stress protein CsbA
MIFQNLFAQTGDYLYFISSLIGLITVIIIFYKNPGLRHEMLISGLSVALAGVLSEYIYFQDYWNPPLVFRFGYLGGIEDLMFGFTAGSLGSVIYNLIFRKVELKKYSQRKWLVTILVVSIVLSIIVFTSVFKLNSIYSTSIGLLIPAIIIVILRKDLLKDMIFSALFCGLLLVLAEGFAIFIFNDYLSKYYLLYNEAPVLFGIFPFTELIWGVSFGALIGPLYEFIEGFGFKEKV